MEIFYCVYSYPFFVQIPVTILIEISFSLKLHHLVLPGVGGGIQLIQIKQVDIGHAIVALKFVRFESTRSNQ